MTSELVESNRLDPVAGTARWTAAERARESGRPDRLFEDPLAEALAGDEGRALAEQMRRDGLFDNPGFAVRTRFFDDVLTTSVNAPGAASQVAGPLIAAEFDPTRPAVWLVEGLLFYLDPAAVHRLLDEITGLSALGSELLIDTIGQSLLESPQMQPMLDRLAEHGIPWRFGTDHPEDDLFAPRGWRAAVSLTSEVGTQLGRWPYPTFPRDTPGVPQSFLAHATR